MHPNSTKSEVPADSEMGLKEAAASCDEAVRRRVKSSVVVVVESECAMSSARVSTAAMGMLKLCETVRRARESAGFVASCSS